MNMRKRLKKNKSGQTPKSKTTGVRSPAKKSPRKTQRNAPEIPEAEIESMVCRLNDQYVIARSKPKVSSF